jgi:hypothetical protein
VIALDPFTLAALARLVGQLDAERRDYRPDYLWGSIKGSGLGGQPGLGSSLSDLLGRLPARALLARLPDGPGQA